MDVDSLVGTVFSGLSALVVQDVADGGGMVVVTARTRDAAVPCPVCGTATAKVHGYHHRTLKDVPVDGRQAVVHLRVRRLVCLWGVRTLHWAAELRRSRTLDHHGMIVRCGVTTAVPDLRPTQ